MEKRKDVVESISEKLKSSKEQLVNMRSQSWNARQKLPWIPLWVFFLEKKDLKLWEVLD